MYEKRPLKRQRLGPPDVYPQVVCQKEDDLSLSNVKHGFPTTPQLNDEFGTARNYNVTASKVCFLFDIYSTHIKKINKTTFVYFLTFHYVYRSEHISLVY